MRRFVYSVAASADGFIARRDGRVDWLDARPAEDYGLARFVAGVDTIVWGRRTFDQAQGFGGVEPFGPGKRHLVLTHHPVPSDDPRVAFTDESPAALAARLRSEPGKDVWLMGGAALASSFAAAEAIDEVVLHVIPVLLGDGVPLLRSLPRDVPLRLLEAKPFPDGVVMLRYAVERTA